MKTRIKIKKNHAFSLWPYRKQSLIQLGYAGANVVHVEVERIASEIGASRIIALGIDNGGARLYR